MPRPSRGPRAPDTGQSPRRPIRRPGGKITGVDESSFFPQGVAPPGVAQQRQTRAQPISTLNGPIPEGGFRGPKGGLAQLGRTAPTASGGFLSPQAQAALDAGATDTPFGRNPPRVPIPGHDLFGPASSEAAPFQVPTDENPLRKLTFEEFIRQLFGGP